MADNIEVGNLVARISFDDTGLSKSMAEIDRQMKLVKSEFDKTASSLKTYGATEDQLKAKSEALGQQMDLQQQKINKLNESFQESAEKKGLDATETTRLATELNKAQTVYNNLEGELKDVNTQLANQPAKISNAEQSWKNLETSLYKAGDKLKEVGGKMTDVGKDLSMKVTAPIVALGTLSVKSAIDFESAFAGIRKTVDATEEQFAVLEQGVRDMSKEMPASAAEIALVGEAAGQLGIKTDNILSFTEVMIGLGEATTMSSEQAATELARLANITKMPQTEFSNLGSSIVALGNNFATTEGDITSMAMRLAGAGSQVGMSEADILGLAAALSSVGIEAEMGGSAMSRVMVNMQVAASTGMTKVQQVVSDTGMSLRDMQLMASNAGMDFADLAQSLGMTKQELKNIIDAGVDLGNFSKIAGMTSDEFKTAFEKDAVGALGKFIDGLGNAEASGESAINMLEEMGISEIRLRDSLLRAGGANELFAESIDISNTAWKENTALQNEVAQRYATTESQLAMFKNTMTDLGITLGNIIIPAIMKVVESIKPWIEKFAALDESMQQVILVIAGIAAAIGPVLIVVGTLVSSIGSIVTVASAAAGAIATAGGAAAVMGSVIAVATGPIGIAVAAIAALTAGGIMLYKHLKKDAIPEIERFSDEVSESTQEAVGSFLDLSDSASEALTEMSLTNKVVTSDMANQMVSTFNKMGDRITEGMRVDHEEQIQMLQSFFANSSVLSAEEEAKAIELTQRNHEERAQVISDGQARIAEIMNAASEARRSLTQLEATEINAIQEQMVETGVRVLSESELEQKIIMERIHQNASALSAKQSAEVVKNGIAQRDGAIEAAEQQYDSILKEIIRQRDEVGSVSAEQAERLIADAKRQRDETVENAESMHEEILSAAKVKAGEHTDLINWETGEVLKKWEVYWNTLQKWQDNINQYFKDAWKNIWESIKTKTQEILDSIKTKFEEIKDYLKNFPDTMKQIGIDIMAGMISGITSMVGNVKDKVKEIASLIPDGLKDFLGIHSPSKVTTELGKWTGQGLAVGLEKSGSSVKKATTDVANIVDTKFNDIMKKVVTQADNAAKGVKNKTTQISKSFNEAFAAITSEKKLGNLSNEQYIKALEMIDQKYAKTGEQHRKVAEAISATNKAIAKEQQELAKKAFEESEKWIDKKKEANELSLTDELKAWERVQERYLEGTAEREEADKNVLRIRKEIYTELNNAAETYLAKTKDINDKLIADEKRLNEAYQKTVDDRAKSISSFAGLFDLVTFSSDKTGTELLSNLESQVNYIDTWSSEIQKLAARGIEEGLLEELRAMGPKAGPEIAALNTLTDDELAKYNNLWKTKSETSRQIAVNELVGLRQDTNKQIEQLRIEAANNLDGVKKEFDKAVKEIRYGTKEGFNALAGDMPSIGKDIIKGLITGLNAMEGPLKNAASTLASGVTTSIKKALDIHSPSRVMMKLGEFTGEGFSKGIQSAAIDVSKSSNMLSSNAVNGVSTSSSSAKPVQNIFNFDRMLEGANLVVRNDTDIKSIAKELFGMTQIAMRGAGIRG
ncbi:MAG: phage tail tape measure protein [Candidatus Pristimantibacillus lignocellulolyticus]|uniref:Phage tail tape measure protein n=1 Tax=Candidatus Pristimantibacillus lignocellulolyticus TaxID=2994561 RepID=A0A9J6ZES6_9BACL|nr:MAG: phage tail tape measure protein [Candidatus Pristimantibacillus lignocellulolyticus]